MELLARTFATMATLLILTSGVGAAGFPAVLDLNSTYGISRLVFPSNGFDFFTLSAGGFDLNGDGIDDLALTTAGPSTWVMFGSRGWTPAETVVTTDLDGFTGFTILTGATSISGAGDFNADGVDDLLLGASDGTLLILGSANGFPATLQPLGTNVDRAILFLGPGGTVASAGDVNNDGISDILIGAPAGDTVYCVFGSATAFPSNNALQTRLVLSDVDGSNGFVIRVSEGANSFGTAVAGPGDVNGDGLDDIVISNVPVDFNAPTLSPPFVAVVYGSPTGVFPPVLDVDDINGKNGFILGVEDNFTSVFIGGTLNTGTADVNGDGINDFVIGVPFTSLDVTDSAGIAYVVFGRAGGGFPARWSTSDLNGENGFAVSGPSALGGDLFSLTIAGPGDVNGDGLDDVIFGTANTAGNAEAAMYVLFGSREPFPARLDLNVTSLDGTNGFRAAFPDGMFGVGARNAGDLNGDGAGDMVVLGVDIDLASGGGVPGGPAPNNLDSQSNPTAAVVLGFPPKPMPQDTGRWLWPFPNTPDEYLYGVCGLCIKHRVQGGGGCGRASVGASALGDFRDSTDGAGAADFVAAACNCCGHQCRNEGVCSTLLNYYIPQTAGMGAFVAIAPEEAPVAAVDLTAVPGAGMLADGAVPSAQEFMEALFDCTTTDTCNVYLSLHTELSAALNPGLNTGAARGPLFRVPVPKGRDPRKVYFALSEPATSANVNAINVPSPLKTRLPAAAAVVTNVLLSWVGADFVGPDIGITLERATVQLDTSATATDPDTGAIVTNDRVIAIQLRTGSSFGSVVNGPATVLFCGADPLPPPLASKSVTSPCNIIFLPPSDTPLLPSSVVTQAAAKRDQTLTSGDGTLFPDGQRAGDTDAVSARSNVAGPAASWMMSESMPAISFGVILIAAVVALVAVKAASLGLAATRFARQDSRRRRQQREAVLC